MVAAQTEPQRLPVVSRKLFITLLLLIVGGAIIRSAMATRLDGFTIDEAYHIAAGVSYVRYADFRINPEHPPLVKLWVGTVISATGFRLSSIRPLADKADERDFAEQDVYLDNDFSSLQRRARIAMWMLNGLLLVALAFRRAQGLWALASRSGLCSFSPLIRRLRQGCGRKAPGSVPSLRRVLVLADPGPDRP